MGTAIAVLLALLMQIGSCPGHHNVLLTWNASATQDVTLYNVWRANQSGGPYSLIGNTSGLSFVDSVVTDSNTYFWCITAVDPSGESDLSQEATAVITP